MDYKKGKRGADIKRANTKGSKLLKLSDKKTLNNENQQENVMPKFGNDSTILDLMTPIFQKSEPDSIIRIGVLDLDDPLFLKVPYNKIKERYSMKLNQEIEDSDINDIVFNRIENISKLTNIDGASSMLKNFYKDDNVFGLDLNDALLSFIRIIFETILRYFKLDPQYWNREHSEPHITSGLFFHTFFNLFYGTNYIVESNKPLFANKVRRNKFKTLDDNIDQALVPDIVIESLLFRRSEVLIVEGSKYKESEDIKKELSDTVKLCTELHDMLNFISEKAISESDLDQTDKIKVYGVIVSGNECDFPVTFYDFPQMRKAILQLVKLRISVDKNIKKLIDISQELELGYKTPLSQSISWSMKIETSPMSARKLKLEELKKKRKLPKDF
nr:9376_t:CDS:2 [Entrophospora candida]